MYQMKVTKSEGKSRVEVGVVEVWIPTLEDFGIEAKATSTDEDGLPVYATNEQNFLFSAIKAAVLANARNKLVSKTADLRPGQTIPTTLEALCQPSIAGGNPEAVKQINAAKQTFKGWVASLGKSEKVNALLNGCFASVKALDVQQSSVREKVAQYIADFAEYCESNGIDLGSYGAAYVEKLYAAATEESEDFDVDDL